MKLLLFNGGTGGSETSDSIFWRKENRKQLVSVRVRFIESTNLLFQKLKEEESRDIKNEKEAVVANNSKVSPNSAKEEPVDDREL